MTSYQFNQPWLSELSGDQAAAAKEFANLRRYLRGLDDGTIPLFNPLFLNATINSLTVGGNIAMGGFKLTGLGAGSTNGDSLRYEQLIGLYLLLTGGTMSGAIAMGSNKVTGLAAATANGDALRFEQNKVIQIVFGTTETAFSTTSSTFQTTNSTVTITPTSASNKVFVLAVGNTVVSVTTATTTSIFRGTTNLATAFISRFNDGGAISIKLAQTLFAIDAPASTSALTYTVKLKSEDNATSVSWGVDAGLQTIVAIEIVA